MRRVLHAATFPARYLGSIAWTVTWIRLDKAGARWHEIREHLAEHRAHRRAGGGGGYPGVDKPMTLQQKRAWDRNVRQARREQG